VDVERLVRGLVYLPVLTPCVAGSRPSVLDRTLWLVCSRPRRSRATWGTSYI